MPRQILRFFLFLFLASVSNSVATSYQLIDLGLLDYENSDFSCINNKGLICGSFNNGHSKNALVCNVKGSINYTNINFSTMPIINDKGVIFGSCQIEMGYSFWSHPQEVIFKWSQPLSYFTNLRIKNLGFPAALKNERVVVISANDDGYVLLMNEPLVEEYDNISFDYQIWLYVNGIFNKIEHPKLLVARKINNQAQILGAFFERTNDYYKIIPSIYDVATKKICTLDFPSLAYGIDINDKGQVVGIFKDPLKNCYYGFFRDYSNKEYITIENFQPIAVNNPGVIIGKFMEGSKKNKPAIWSRGALQDLNDLIPGLIDNKGHIWQSLDKLIDINDAGYIIGRGKYNGKRHGFLLSPMR